MIECVCPPQISIKDHGRVDGAADFIPSLVHQFRVAVFI